MASSKRQTGSDGRLTRVRHVQVQACLKSTGKRQDIRRAGLALLTSVVLGGTVLCAPGNAVASTHGPRAIHVKHFTNSLPGMKTTRCEVNESGNDALAYGTFNSRSKHGNEIVVQLFDRQGASLGRNARLVAARPGTPWSIQVHLTSGLGPPDLCGVGEFTAVST